MRRSHPPNPPPPRRSYRAATVRERLDYTPGAATPRDRSVTRPSPELPMRGNSTTRGGRFRKLNQTLGIGTRQRFSEDADAALAAPKYRVGIPRPYVRA